MDKSGQELLPPPSSQAPWLVYTNWMDMPQKIQDICNVVENDGIPNIKNIPELEDKTIRASCHGWLLLKHLDDSKTFSLWNPDTLKTICLPPLQAPDWTNGRIISCDLTFSPVDAYDSGDCIVLVLCTQVLFSFRPGRDISKWGVQRYELEGKSIELFNAVSCKGVIYGWCWQLSTDGKKPLAVVLEFGDHELNLLFTLRPLKIGLPTEGSPYFDGHNYVIESLGVVYIVTVFMRRPGGNIDAIKVWQLHSESMNWVETYSLGNRAFFIDNEDGCTWCWASPNVEFESEIGLHGVERNCVYYVRHRALWLYRLEDRSMASFSLCKNLVPDYEAFWAMPHCQRLLSGQVQRPSTIHLVSEGVGIVCYGCSSNMDGAKFNLFSLLPSETISLISERLHLFDYLNFRASCKILRSANPPAQWRTNNSLPLFIFSNNDGGLCKVMDPCRNGSCSIDIPMLSRGEVFVDFSKNGWLLINTAGECLQYFNPFTGVKGDYPPLQDMFRIASIGFSTFPTSSDCLTVGIIFYHSFIRIAYLLSGEESWQFEDFPLGEALFCPSSCSPVYYDGAFWFLGTEGHLGIFELIEGRPSWKLYSTPQTIRYSFYHSYHLVECGGEMLSVYVDAIGQPLLVYSFNRSEDDWTEVCDLGNHILFLGPSSSFSVMTTESRLRNRVYLPRLHGDGILFYSLDTKDYNAFGRRESLEDFHGTKKPLRCTWI